MYGKTGNWTGQRYLDIGYGSGQNMCWIEYSGGSFSVTSGKENWPVVGSNLVRVQKHLRNITVTISRPRLSGNMRQSGGMNYDYGTDDGNDKQR